MALLPAINHNAKMPKWDTRNRGFKGIARKANTMQLDRSCVALARDLDVTIKMMLPR